MSYNSTQHEIYYDEVKDFVIMNWKGYTPSYQFREGTEYMLKVLEDNKAQKVLADTKEMVLISTDDQRWIETNFIPRAVKVGFKAIAILKPTSYFNQIAMESISYKVNQNILQIRIFDDKEEAINWLLTM